MRKSAVGPDGAWVPLGVAGVQPPADGGKRDRAGRASRTDHPRIGGEDYAIASAPEHPSVERIVDPPERGPFVLDMQQELSDWSRWGDQLWR
ncbi:hypothetical protein [Streptomyces sp. NPDC001480]|uniref:hypothetical protein n=1 Tax=Streptomyces sp. NPDC001480 TaxID=3364577 RepID=UPI0036BA3B82